MTNPIYSDLLIVNEDILLDDGQNPVITTDRVVIAQDIKHAILESGLAVELVAERSPTEIADVEHRIILLAEDDLRVIPGTGKIQRINDKRQLTAKSYDFGVIEAWL
ncbi:MULTISPECIES: DUF2590 family protein [unclassified Vibrio]|uniref:DUF2590 family protein n=1 Tax=unclassified Vibrio TaxID=2614977 RepID=UPI0013618D26|nr:MULTISPECIES: DUF2590 family protein [unclassified Vibrio]NAW59639.1 DUF2590 family protein [Vibrio sp. V36_P2S2PM302]NAX21283.1 DUF2590 family protein [Vibrio sp. V39_P1S14PM300]NAX25021.1 DUF2590 family protein [Vibrio sp. V38_P2S17PM301]NAX28607.1 DUF2590 family protein [Vibrio sp. V37_P2S8PM304]